MKTVCAWCAVLIFSIGLAAGQTPTLMPVASQQALVNKYCTGCHNDRSKTGGFSWTTISLADPSQNAEQSEKVIRKLLAGAMPPAGSPRPDVASAKGLAL